MQPVVNKASMTSQLAAGSPQVTVDVGQHTLLLVQPRAEDIYIWLLFNAGLSVAQQACTGTLPLVQCLPIFGIFDNQLDVFHKCNMQHIRCVFNSLVLLHIPCAYNKEC